MADETPKPRLVQAPGDFKAPEGDDNKTASAQARFAARPHDGLWTPEDQVVSEPAKREAVVEAFEEYQERPDIESRASILAREGAYPGQFSEKNVQSGSVDDGLRGVDGPGYGKEDDEAKKEAKSVKNLTAKKD